MWLGSYTSQGHRVHGVIEFMCVTICDAYSDYPYGFWCPSRLWAGTGGWIQIPALKLQHFLSVRVSQNHTRAMCKTIMKPHHPSHNGIYMSINQGCQMYPIVGYSTSFQHFVPQKILYPWGTLFVPHFSFEICNVI